MQEVAITYNELEMCVTAVANMAGYWSEKVPNEILGISQEMISSQSKIWYELLDILQDK